MALSPNRPAAATGGGSVLEVGAELRRPVATMLALAIASATAVGAAAAIQPLLGLVAVAAVAAALVFSQRPVLAVYVLVLIAPACAGLQRGLVVPGLRVSEAAIAGIGILVLLFAPRVARPRWSRVEILLLLYAAATVCLGGFDLATRHAPLTTEDLGTMLGPVQFVLLLRVVVVAMGKETYRLRAAQLLLAAAALVSLVALAQYANLGPTRSLLAQVTGSVLYSSTLGAGVARVTGPFNIWHELAGFLMPSILLALALLCSGGGRGWRLFYAAVFALGTMALVSTAAVGIMVMTAIGCFYVAWRRRLLHVAVVVAVPVALIVAVLFGGTLDGRVEQQYAPTSTTYRIPYAPQSISYRYALFREQNAPALAGRWATGYGPDLPPRLALGNFPFSQTTYVTLLLRGGVPLLAIFLLLTAAVVQAARRAQRGAATDLQWSIATVVLVTTLSYVVLQLIEAYMLDAGPPHSYWAFVGLMLAAGAGVEPRGSNARGL
jgi:hypothetical protein